MILSQVLHPIDAANTAPVLATNIARELKAIGGQIWLIQLLDYGLVLRCEVATKQLRLILPSLVNKEAVIPSEKGVSSFIVRSINDLHVWLSALSL